MSSRNWWKMWLGTHPDPARHLLARRPRRGHPQTRSRKARRSRRRGTGRPRLPRHGGVCEVVRGRGGERGTGAGYPAPTRPVRPSRHCRLPERPVERRGHHRTDRTAPRHQRVAAKYFPQTAGRREAAHGEPGARFRRARRPRRASALAGILRHAATPREQPEAWRAAHRRLYEHLSATTKEGDQPTLEDLQPLYQAVAHGCQAGLQQEVCDKV
jgi:hypothetical protein